MEAQITRRRRLGGSLASTGVKPTKYGRTTNRGHKSGRQDRASPKNTDSKQFHTEKLRQWSVAWRRVEKIRLKYGALPKYEWKNDLTPTRTKSSQPVVIRRLRLKRDSTGIASIRVATAAHRVQMDQNNDGALLNSQDWSMWRLLPLQDADSGSACRKRRQETRSGGKSRFYCREDFMAFCWDLPSKHGITGGQKKKTVAHMSITDRCSLEFRTRCCVRPVDDGYNM